MFAQVVSFVHAHGALLATFALLCVSEFLGTHPDTPYKSILQLLVPPLRNASEPEIEKINPPKS